MASRQFPATYGLALTYLSYWSECIAMGVETLAGITERAASNLVSHPRSVARGEYTEDYEGFFAGLEDGTPFLFCPSMRDREALLPYIGMLCGGDSL